MIRLDVSKEFYQEFEQKLPATSRWYVGNIYPELDGYNHYAVKDFYTGEPIVFVLKEINNDHQKAANTKGETQRTDGDPVSED